MFFGGDYLGFDDAIFAAARLLEIVSAAVRPRRPPGRPAQDVRHAGDSGGRAEEEKFAIVERAAAHFAARYPVNTIDGVRITFPKGWGLLRASNTQAILVLRFEATDRPRSTPTAARSPAGSPNRACASSP